MIDLPNKLEEAAAFLASDTTNEAKVFTGQSDQIRKRPAIGVHATGGDEMPQGSGNFLVNLSVVLLANSKDYTIAAFRTLGAIVSAPFMSDDIAERLSASAEEFTAFGFRNRSLREDIQEDSFRSELSMDVYCCASSVT